MSTPSAPSRTEVSPRLLTRYGPWAVVTGASDGIGREIAIELARSGLGVALVSRRRERLDALAQELSDRHQVATRVVAADLTSPSGVDAVVEATADLDVGLLVAAAGFGTSGSFLEASLQEELEMIDVNCRAVAALCHHFGRRFAARHRGGLVLFSSLVAFQGVPLAANYSATKAWVQTFAEGLRAELAPLGVDVVASAPGPIHSGFASRANMRLGMALPARSVVRPTLNALGRRTTVRPGWLSKLLELSLSLLPRSGRTRVMAAVMRGMTAHME